MKKGFTLVEVTATVAIIGLIAVATLPLMIHNTNKSKNIEQLKKVATSLNSAVSQAMLTNGSVLNWNWGTKDSVVGIMQNVIGPKMNVGYKCSGDPTGTNPRCNYKIRGIDGNESPFEDFDPKSKVFLNDGTLIGFSDALRMKSESEGGGEDDNTSQSGCNTGITSRSLCGVFLVDVNGASQPNRIGVDVFFYGVYASGSVLPIGSNDGGEYIEQHCAKDADGMTCAAKLVKDGWDACYRCTNPYPLMF